MAITKRQDNQDEIIQFIRTNRISSTEIADCLGKSGLLSEGLTPVTRGHFRVGRVSYAVAVAGSNYPVHQDIENLGPDTVVLVDALDCQNKSLCGNLVAKYLLLYRQSQALVALGNLRDAPHLIREAYPIWCNGFSPIGCSNQAVDLAPYKEQIDERRDSFKGRIAVCDDSGVVVIPMEAENDFMERLHWIEDLEDVWFDCIDRRKWSTFETVCLKRYESEPSSNLIFKRKKQSGAP
jgi:regulator of RNase E activity RraA